MNLTRSSRWTLLSTLLLLAATGTLAAIIVPASRWTSALTALAGLTGILAGLSTAFSDFGPKIQRRAALASLALLAGSVGILIRMILHAWLN
jgi:hypothetical protein